MNELRFRAWLEDKKEYFYFTVYNTKPFEASIVEVSLGIQDCQKELIYAGDIIEIVSTFEDRKYHFYAVVTWNPKLACFMCDDWRIDELLSDPIYTIQVIGTVLENPNLLEKHNLAA